MKDTVFGQKASSKHTLKQYPRNSQDIIKRIRLRLSLLKVNPLSKLASILLIFYTRFYGEVANAFQKSCHPALWMSTLISQINHTVLVFAEFMMDTLQHTNAIMTCTLIINVSLSSMPIVLPQQKAGLVNDAIVSFQLTLANAKRPEKTLLNLTCNGIKSYQDNLFIQIMSDDSFIHWSGARSAFSYAMLSIPSEGNNNSNAGMPKPDLFG